MAEARVVAVVAGWAEGDSEAARAATGTAAGVEMAAVG